MMVLVRAPQGSGLARDWRCQNQNQGREEVRPGSCHPPTAFPLVDSRAGCAVQQKVNISSAQEAVVGLSLSSLFFFSPSSSRSSTSPPLNLSYSSIHTLYLLNQASFNPLDFKVPRTSLLLPRRLPELRFRDIQAAFFRIETISTY